MKTLIKSGRSELPKVLLVDDEIEILQSLTDLLRKEFHVLATSSAEQALQCLEENDCALVISDQRMPQMKGTELLKRAGEISPDTVCILLTGYADIEAVVQCINKCHAYYYLTKPWSSENLLALVRKCVNDHQNVIETRKLLVDLANANAALSVATENHLALEQDHATENEILQKSVDHLKNSYWLLNKIQEVLPFCMECHRVKSTASSWETLVDFMKENSNFFSHGYCPDCLPKIYERNGIRPPSKIA